ncbi:hypothetical protein L2719_03125 [Shewanella schlegeliana]|uniref:Uncharacterized protein n=1 Tax=Shewanella schlegeliana TaxID=190308 RepID=A0ABS1T0H0_9GAMM|nr:hypothetical protein [Shewanella schlegeliana]MBL4913669.1 hypothetical protein [Shewanella schlegeliana]MCL1108560.1 hypothetical protein [Shewanella schlegeliana]GIU31046.1 hypothetical protein TUM4433_22270 [Shewanella schlegeliana]
MRKIIAGLLVGYLGAIPVAASELQLYQDPIPYGNYITDLDRMLSDAAKRHHWVFSKEESGLRSANLDYKSYKVKVELVVKDNSVAVKLISAERPDCGKKSCKVDMDRVDGWLVKLRRSIAYDVTKAVRDDALKRRFVQ